MAKKKYTEDYLELDEIKLPSKKINNKKDKIDISDIITNFKNNKYSKHFIVLAICSVLLFVAIINFLHNVYEQNKAIITNTTTSVAYAEPTEIDNNEPVKPEQVNDEIINTDVLNENLINTLVGHYNNDDIVMYLTIFDNNDVVNIEQPIAQSVNNTYYLDHNLNKQFDQYGSAFVDYRLTFDNTPKSLVIYGNDAFEDSPLFNMQLYLDKNFFDNNKKIEIKLKDRTLNYSVFAFSEVEWNFSEENVVFDNKEIFNNYLENIKSKAKYIDNENLPTVEDNIIVISTSSNKASENRFVLYGKLDK